MENFQRISNVDDKDIPFSLAKSTLYKWANQKKYPTAFKKIAGLRLVNLEELKRVLETSTP